MNTSKILSRLSDPGFILVIIGALVAYGSPLWKRILPEKARNNGKIVLQAAGCVIAVIGAVIMFT